MLIDILKKARARIDKPSKWCAYWSQSEDGKRLGADGAIWWACEDERLRRLAFHVLAKFSSVACTRGDLTKVICVGPHREVMAMFDKAIQKLTKDGLSG